MCNCTYMEFCKISSKYSIWFRDDQARFCLCAMLVQWNSQVIISYYHSLSLLGTSHSKAAQCTRALKFVQKLISHFWRYCWFWSKGYWTSLNCWISKKSMYSFDCKFYNFWTKFRDLAQCAPRLLPTTGAGGVHQGDYLPGLNRNGWREIAFGWFARNLIGWRWPNLT